MASQTSTYTVPPNADWPFPRPLIERHNWVPKKGTGSIAVECAPSDGPEGRYDCEGCRVTLNIADVKIQHPSPYRIKAACDLYLAKVLHDRDQAE